MTEKRTAAVACDWWLVARDGWLVLPKSGRRPAAFDEAGKGQHRGKIGHGQPELRRSLNPGDAPPLQGDLQGVEQAEYYACQERGQRAPAPDDQRGEGDVASAGGHVVGEPPSVVHDEYAGNAGKAAVHEGGAPPDSDRRQSREPGLSGRVAYRKQAQTPPS